MSIRGHLPSASLETFLEHESKRLDTDIRFRTHGRFGIEPTPFDSIPHVVLQTSGSEWPISVRGIQLEVVRPHIRVTGAELIEVEGHALAVATGPCVFMLVPLVELLEQPETYVSSDEPEEKMLELLREVVQPGLDRACEFIDQYDYEYERDWYAEKRLEVELREADQPEHSPADLQRPIENAAERLKTMLRRFHCNRDVVELSENRLKQMEPDFDAILERMPHSFSHLHVRDTHLRTYTTPISIEFDGEVYLMGQFLVDVDLQSMSVDVAAHVDNQMVDGHIHPHLEADGTPRWHAFAPRLMTCLGEHRVPEALGVVSDFLQTYVPEAACLELERFESRN